MSADRDPSDLRWTALDVRRFVLAQLVVLVLVAMASFFGGFYFDARVFLSEPAPTPFRCAEYTPADGAPRWVRLGDCFVDADTALVEQRSHGGVIERPGALRFVALHGTPHFRRDATLMLATPSPPTEVGPHTFEGVVRSRTELRRSLRLGVRDSDLAGIDRDFWTLRRDERPNLWSAAPIVAVWLLAGVLGFAIVRKQIGWRAQRKRWEAEQAARAK